AARTALESNCMVELPPPFVLKVGARKGPLPFWLNRATARAPKMLPLPPPSRLTEPSPNTRISPLKLGLPFISRVPFTTSKPAPPSRLQSPSTKVKAGDGSLPEQPLDVEKYRPCAMASAFRSAR